MREVRELCSPYLVKTANFVRHNYCLGLVVADVDKGTYSMAMMAVSTSYPSCFTIASASDHNLVRPFSTQIVVSDISNRHDRDSMQQTCTR